MNIEQILISFDQINKQLKLLVLSRNRSKNAYHKYYYVEMFSYMVNTS